MKQGFGKCPDCVWFNQEEGCNVERDSPRCKLNKKLNNNLISDDIVDEISNSKKE
jgi:hypothetical protein